MARTKDQSRSAVQARRVSFILGPLAGLALYVMGKGIMSTDQRETFPRNSIIFGDMQDWPSYMRDFWPVDLAFTMFGFWLLMQLMLRSNRSEPDFTSFKSVALLSAGIFVGTGALGICLGTMLGGWYTGIEFFFLMGAAMTLATWVLAAVCVALLGLMWLLARAWELLWARIAPTGLGKKMVGVRDYYNAADVPEDEPVASGDQDS